MTFFPAPILCEISDSGPVMHMGRDAHNIYVISRAREYETTCIKSRLKACETCARTQGKKTQEQSTLQGECQGSHMAYDDGEDLKKEERIARARETHLTRMQRPAEREQRCG